MTPEDMDHDLKYAMAILIAMQSPLKVYRSRHESTTQTSLWFFDEHEAQIGSATRLESGAWRCNRMLRGSPTSERSFMTLVGVVGHIAGKWIEREN